MSEPSDAVARRRVMAVVAGGNFAQLGARLLLSPVVPLVVLEFDATKSGVGLALSGMWAVYALVQFPSGVLADRAGERRLLAAGLAGTALGSALVALAPDLLAYGLFVLLLGAGAGLFFAPASALFSRLYEESGGPLGALTAGGAVAGVVYPAAAGLVGDAHGWRPAVALGAVVALPLLAATLRVLPRLEPASPERPLAALVDVGRIRGLLRRPGVVYSTLVAVLFAFTFQSVSSFLPTFLVEFRGLDTGTAGVAFGGLFAASSLVQPVAGRLSDRTSRDLALASGATLAATGLVVLLTVPGTAATVAGTLVLGAGISWPGVVQARVMDQLGDAERGFGFGLVRTTYMLLAASGSVVVGSLADLGGWVLAYGTVVALLGVVLVVLGTNRVARLGL